MYSFELLINYDSSFTSSQISYRVLEYIMKIDLYYKSFMLYYFLFSNWGNDISLTILEQFPSFDTWEGNCFNSLTWLFYERYKYFLWVWVWKISWYLYLVIISEDNTFYGMFIMSFSWWWIQNFIAFKNFKTPCFDLTPWASLDYMDNTSSIKNIFKKYQKVYQIFVQLHIKYFIIYKVCVCLHFSLDFIQNIYPTIFQDIFPKASNFIEEFASFLDPDSLTLSKILLIIISITIHFRHFWR